MWRIKSIVIITMAIHDKMTPRRMRYHHQLVAKHFQIITHTQIRDEIDFVRA